jgi:hypothetical protein
MMKQIADQESWRQGMGSYRGTRIKRESGNQKNTVWDEKKIDKMSCKMGSKTSSEYETKNQMN